MGQDWLTDLFFKRDGAAFADCNGMILDVLEKAKNHLLSPDPPFISSRDLVPRVYCQGQRALHVVGLHKHASGV